MAKRKVFVGFSSCQGFKKKKSKHFQILYYVPIGSEKIRRLHSFLLFSYFCSLIWLYHLMDDCNSCHIINLRGTKKKKKTQYFLQLTANYAHNLKGPISRRSLNHVKPLGMSFTGFGSELSSTLMGVPPQALPYTFVPPYMLLIVIMHVLI
jgi:hypothetical protein